MKVYYKTSRNKDNIFLTLYNEYGDTYTITFKIRSKKFGLEQCNNLIKAMIN